MFYPLTFEPIFKERVWGGRKLEDLYRKKLPPHVLIGESWEICDRPDESSRVASGPLAGRSLRWLMEHHLPEVVGDASVPYGRFPLLVKLLDASQVLSVQVHPPPGKAAELKGEPKTELWFVAEAVPGAELLAGLRRGVTRRQFETQIADGTLAQSLHRIRVRRGDTLFLPSGRVHALGAGVVVFEIQQNSDTTYRVFDWNRVGLDGRSRTLHIAESLASIDFNDFEPSLVQAPATEKGGAVIRPLIENAVFRVWHCRLREGASLKLNSAKMEIIGVVSGVACVSGGQTKVTVKAGEFTLLPACLEQSEVSATGDLEFLQIQAGSGSR